MPIVSGDIDFHHSMGTVTTSAAVTVGVFPAGLGGTISTTQIVDATLENLFDNVTGQESNDGDVEYRGFYVKNNTGTALALENARIWIQTQTPSPNSTVEIAKADEGVNGTMETIANESTAPSGPSFTAPATKAAGIPLGNIPAGQHFGIWIRRTIDLGSAAFNNDGPTIRVEGDTQA